MRIGKEENIMYVLVALQIPTTSQRLGCSWWSFCGCPGRGSRASESWTPDVAEVVAISSRCDGGGVTAERLKVTYQNLTDESPTPSDSLPRSLTL